jgi:hypothetical protein
MSFEELLQEHIKALNENTQAIKAYTRALNSDNKNIEVEHTKDSACRFCGITYKTLQTFLECGVLAASRRKAGKREYFKEKDLVALCESKKLYAGDYGHLKSTSGSPYYVEY